LGAADATILAGARAEGLMPVPAQHGHGLKLAVDAMVVPNCVETHPSGLRSLLGSWTPANQVRGDLGLPSVSLACWAKVEKEEGTSETKLAPNRPPFTLEAAQGWRGENSRVLAKDDVVGIARRARGADVRRRLQ